MYWDPVWHIVEQVLFAARTGPQVHPFYCKQSKQKAIKKFVIQVGFIIARSGTKKLFVTIAAWKIMGLT